MPFTLLLYSYPTNLSLLIVFSYEEIEKYKVLGEGGMNRRS